MTVHREISTNKIIDIPNYNNDNRDQSGFCGGEENQPARMILAKVIILPCAEHLMIIEIFRKYYILNQ